MFSKFFIQRPIFATVLAVVMVLAGIMAGLSLPIAQFPDITPPTIFVSASYPGADAETLARTVAEPIEAQVNGVEGMIYMSSTSSSDGQYSLTVTFENGTDIDQAAVDVQNRISQIDATLPEAVKQQGMNVMKRSSNMLLFISIDADSTAGKAYDALYLTNYAQLHLTEPLSRVEGVGNVSAFGGGDYDMRIWLKPEVMKIRGVSASEVQQAIESQNLHVSAGSVGQSPGAGGASFEYTLTADGELNDTEQFRNIIIRTDPDGSVLHLRDIADVELGSSSYSQIARVNGKQTTLIGISQLPGANALETADGALKELDRLSKYFPEGVTYNVINNSTDYVRESIKEVGVTFLETTAIVMLVILLFLQNWRAVIIPMITIPVSLIATLAVMKLFGFTLNTLTLFGLVLAIAIVVDDAIVVVEDCMRILDEGKLNRVQAAEQAMKELTGPVVGEVLVLLSVFIPTAFISGITGQLYKQFALTIAVSTAFSGFNALTLTPALCALFLKPSTPKKNLIYRGFNKVWGKVEGFYGATVSKMLRRAGAWTIAFIAAALAGVYLYTKYPSSYLPEEDMGYCIASLQLPTGATLDRTEKVMQTLERSFKQEIPAIKDIMTISGISMMGGGDNSNSGSIFVMLKPWNQRGKGESVEDVMAQMTEIAYRVQQEGVFFAANPPSIPGLGSSSGMQMQILDINSLGADALANAVQTMEQSLQATGNYSRVNSMYESGVPQYRIVVDRDRAALRGLAIEDIYSALSAFTGGAYTGQINDFGHTFQVTVQATGDARRTVESLNALSVPNSKGEMVPFSAFADVKAVEGLPSVSRYNMYTTADLTAIPKSGVSSSTAIAQMEETLRQKLGTNFSYAWTGMAYEQTQSGTTISMVFIFAIVMTILVLAAQYESWTDPLAVVLAMPIAALGCLLGCVLMGESVDIYTQIGLILLLGMAAKNAILIVEYAMDFRKEGKPILQAAQDAGVIRFRPIMMTALAFIFGVMPMLFDHGAGAGSRHAIGTAIVFGMAVNAFLGTFFVPGFWKVMQTFGERCLSGLFPLPKKKSASTEAAKPEEKQE